MIRLKVHLEKTEIPNKNDGNFYIKSSTNKQWTPKQSHTRLKHLSKHLKTNYKKKNIKRRRSLK